jgi:hypothetical protein
MSGNGKNGANPAIRNRRLVVKAGLLVLYVALTLFVFINGRSHTFLLDNKSLNDGAVPAMRRVKVFIDNQKPIELYARDRELLMVRGQGHRIRIETQDPANQLEAKFSVPFGDDMILISVPKMASGADDFWEQFIIHYERPTNNDAPPPTLEEPVPIESTL